MPTIPGTSPEAAETVPVSPGSGEHGRAILRDLGLDDAEIDRLAGNGAVTLKN
jgi:crotonobetainyl-CoA:carnitine CoA-transferase CaiB-like acyl-CoA transferase